MAEPLIVHGVARDAERARARVDELLEAVQLPAAYGDRFPHELSGGQRQRASLARALALEPKLLIADEPTSALDVSVQARVLELFVELQERFGFATLFITHDLAVVDLLAHRVLVLHKGEVAETGPTAQVLGNPQDPYTKRLLASLPVPDPVEQAQRRNELRAAGSGVTDPGAGFAVRAEDLTLGYGRDGDVAVSGVTFQLPLGGILGVVGEAGSGKSTLAHAIAAQSEPGEREAPRILGGELDVLGTPLSRLSDRRRSALAIRVGYLPQDGGSTLEPHLTIGENVAVAHLHARSALRPLRGGRRGRDPGRRGAAAACR